MTVCVSAKFSLILNTLDALYVWTFPTETFDALCVWTQIMISMDSLTLNSLTLMDACYV